MSARFHNVPPAMASYKVQHSKDDQEFFINFEEKEGVKAFLKYEK